MNADPAGFPRGCCPPTAHVAGGTGAGRRCMRGGRCIFGSLRRPGSFGPTLLFEVHPAIWADCEEISRTCDRRGQSWERTLPTLPMLSASRGRRHPLFTGPTYRPRGLGFTSWPTVHCRPRGLIPANPVLGDGEPAAGPAVTGHTRVGSPAPLPQGLTIGVINRLTMRRSLAGVKCSPGFSSSASLNFRMTPRTRVPIVIRRGSGPPGAEGRPRRLAA